MKECLLSINKKDFEIQTFRSGGPGGQHQNKTNSGVRIIHKESGAVGESREHKSQLQNKKAALQRLTKTVNFKLWLNKKIFEIDNKKTMEETIEKLTEDRNLKIEARNNKKWEIIN